MTINSILVLPIAACCLAAPMASATVAVNGLFSDHMVLQRDMPCPIWGTAAASKTITVAFNGQTKTATSDAAGNWQLNLDAIPAKTTGSSLTIAEDGANTLTFSDVVVGDVWICGGQSNMAFPLGFDGGWGCNRQADVDSANFPGIRFLTVPGDRTIAPQKTLKASWNVCSPASVAPFSAVAYYFGKKIYQDQSAKIPIGLITAASGGTVIDIWMAPEGAADIPALKPIYKLDIMPARPNPFNPGLTFSAFNSMLYPLVPCRAKGMIWYQGESGELSHEVPDGYYLKEKTLQQGWQRAFGLDDFAMYVVQLANLDGQSNGPTPDKPGSWADVRQMQEMVVNLPHGGMASAIDIGDNRDIHPKDKLAVGERLALWALKNDYGRTNLVTSGPILNDTVVVKSTTAYPTRKSIVCGFDFVGAGLMVGSKEPYVAAKQDASGTLQKFVIAGADGVWSVADAVIKGSTVEVSSATVAEPTQVAYAYWQNPAGANLYNKDGLPASPFFVDDVSAKFTVTAAAGSGGSIGPVGAKAYLKRRTALYTITPEKGRFIQDVKVDGVSVGSVKAYTFDPLSANHTISATFASSAPSYTIAVSSNTGGTIVPSAALKVTQGASQSFSVMPNANYRILSVTADGAPVGNRNRFTFTDVRTNHTISALFAPIPEPGTGKGLRSDYYAGDKFDTFRVSRADPSITHGWWIFAPTPEVPAAAYSVRWTGEIEPQFSETYTFRMTQTYRARLWVNDKLLVDNWDTKAPETGSGSIALSAGKKVPVKIEYYYNAEITNNGGGFFNLEWLSASQPWEVVPQSQLYETGPPVYTLSMAPVENGSLSPAGTVLANPGGSQTYRVLPAFGYRIKEVKVDEVSKGDASTFTVANITANHTITATFAALPTYPISGKVTKQGGGSGIAGATVGIYAAADLTGSPLYSAITDASGKYSISAIAGTWHTSASATGYMPSAAKSVTVKNAPILDSHIALAASGRNVPRTADLLFSMVTDSLPDSGETGNRTSYLPSGQSLTTIGKPTVEKLGDVKWQKNSVATTDGYRLDKKFSEPIPANGATIVMAVKPKRNGIGADWTCIVDYFGDRLVLGLKNDSGQVFVFCNGFRNNSEKTIPDGQVTILSLVVQPDAKYKVYANGTEVMDNTGRLSDMTSINPNFNGGHQRELTLGGGSGGWSTFNGNIGDVFVYRLALSDADRQTLEADLKSKFAR